MISIPADDRPTFDLLKEEVRKEINTWIRVVNEVDRRADTIGIVEAISKVATDFGLKPGTVKTRFYASKKDGWRGLVDRRKLGSGTRKVKPQFIEYWHGLVLDNKRNTSKAFTRFVEDYRRGEIIPGMPAPAERDARLPRGVTLRNLRRNVPAKATIVMARQGIAAARHFLPTGVQDIRHIRPLEYILFDDVELDFLAILPGYGQPVKIRLLIAMDLCSRVILGYGVRPAIIREDGKEDGLKLRDMKALVARFLRTWGIPIDYQMHFIVERATAALPDAAKTALAEISNGQIVVHDTSMIVGRVFEFRDKATGNSWGKSWIESFFQSLHAELADQPGQKGRRYDLAPAELDGRRKEFAALIKAGKRLPIEMRHLFRYPFKSLEEALQELDAAIARLNRREDHQLECFERVALFQVNEKDTPKLASEMPDWLIPMSGKLIWDTRIEQPLERFERLLGPLESRMVVPDSSLHRLMEDQVRVRFANLQFAFQRDRVDYVYLPSDSMLPLLKEGEHFLLWFHPQDMEIVYVTRDRPHLGYVGKLTRFTAGRRGDLEDAKRYLAEKQRMLGHALTAAQQVKISQIRQHGDDLEANAELIRQGIQATEVEVDVIAPGSSSVPSVPSVSSTAIETINADRDARAAQQQQAKQDAARLRKLSKKTDITDFIPAEAPAAESPDADSFLSPQPPKPSSSPSITDFL